MLYNQPGPNITSYILCVTDSASPPMAVHPYDQDATFITQYPNTPMTEREDIYSTEIPSTASPQKKKPTSFQVSGGSNYWQVCVIIFKEYLSHKFYIYS